MACSATRGSMSDDGSTMIRAMRCADGWMTVRWRSASDRGGAKSANAVVRRRIDCSTHNKLSRTGNSKFSESITVFESA